MSDDTPGNPPGGKRPGPQRTMIAPLPGRGKAPPQASPPPQRNAWDSGAEPRNAWDNSTNAGGSAFGAAAPPPASGARPLPGAGSQPHSPPGPQAAPWTGGGAGGNAGGWPGTPGGQPPAADPWNAGGAPSPTPQADQGQHAWIGSSRDAQFFPGLGRPEQQAPTPQTARISLDKALTGDSTGYSAGSNPLTSAAAGLLILLGRLRSQVVEMNAVPLMTHVAQVLEGFDRRAVEAGADPQDALVAKYVLSGTADDIVQNLPGTDRDIWIQYSMEARFFNRRTSGVGIFEEIDKALMDAHRKYHLLELMLTALYQGFEGKFRGAPGGDVDLQQKRRQIYETLRHVRARPDDDISPQWQGVQARPLYQRRQVPLWVVASLVLALLSGGYIGMRMYLADVSGSLSTDMRGLHPREKLALLHVSILPDLPPEPEPYVPPVFDTPGQLDRIRTALSSEIGAGSLSAETRGNFIAVTANNLVLFDSGSADARAEFQPIAQRIAAMLEVEPGAVQVVGHTDSVPLSGRGRFKNNQELSVARAQSVANMILPALSSPERLTVVGRGEDDPIADNASADGRAENRRVEILIQREDT
ncbi:type VI secretion system protein TssL, long form [Roseibaca sp. V10]|uniref:Type VI secretion system protein TssL, long form n=1 Tax=Roseinatronobacter domitianus TaxID=2940293 RepID=A0ABT0M2U7_9RHOB|nr:type VI secretion system protein TssL, long form [Roseibaca domitiana]MCL1629172.1 type VI secretion system protein TssL, long form [Roseibaca domitiana]